MFDASACMYFKVTMSIKVKHVLLKGCNLRMHELIEIGLAPMCSPWIDDSIHVYFCLKFNDKTNKVCLFLFKSKNKYAFLWHKQMLVNANHRNIWKSCWHNL